MLDKPAHLLIIDVRGVFFQDDIVIFQVLQEMPAIGRPDDELAARLQQAERFADGLFRNIRI